MKYYAGIGSRETPPDVLGRMTLFAEFVSRQGYVLRSGGARGADTAFANGTDRKVIFRPKDATPEAIELASQYHPAWDRCNEHARRLHGRNAMIILGEDLKSPVRFVACWTKDGREDHGGTAFGIRIARAHGIDVHNFWHIGPGQWVPIP